MPEIDAGRVIAALQNQLSDAHLALAVATARAADAEERLAALRTESADDA